MKSSTQPRNWRRLVSSSAGTSRARNSPSPSASIGPSKSSSPAGEERLARQLHPISYPSGGLLLDDVTVLAQEVPGTSDDQIRHLLRRGGRR